MDKNINFTSRSIEIRNADNFARWVKESFPLISSTKYARMGNNVHFQNACNKCVDEINLTRYFMNSAESYESWYQRCLEPILARKFGNCYEHSLLAIASALVNNIKNCKISHLTSLSDSIIDHWFLLVNGEKPYIIDTFFGFADYVPEALKRYKNELQNFISREPLPEKVKIVRDNSYYGEIWNNIVEEDHCGKISENIMQMFPNLVLNKRKVGF